MLLTLSETERFHEIDNVYLECEYRHPIEVAAESGNLSSIKWMYENGWRLRQGVMSQTAMSGHFELVKWLKENGCPWNQSVFTCAAYGGNMQLITWLRDGGCPWNDAKAITCAVSGGHLDVVKWLRDQGCSWDSNAIRLAKETRRNKILEWLIKNGCPQK